MTRYARWSPRKVTGYVFMIGKRPAGPPRATRDEAMADGEAAGEVYHCPQYRRPFLGPLAWINEIA